MKSIGGAENIVLHLDQFKSRPSQTMPKAIDAVTGMVSSHAQTILSTTVHLIAFKRRAAPTPMIAAEILCVVETGIPRWVAARITSAELVSAANPLIGCNFTILCPSVLIIRQPPTAVPAAITSAQVTLIQTAIPMSLPGRGSGVWRNESQPGNPS